MASARQARRLWKEYEQPTAEAFIVWTRGVWNKDLVPIIESLFEAAHHGARCWEMDHEAGMRRLFESDQRLAELTIENYRLRRMIDDAENARTREHQTQDPTV